MRGSLEEPPIVIEQDRAQTIFVSLVFSALSAFLVVLGTQAVHRVYEAYYLAAVFGLSAIAFALMAFKPASLIIDQNGITFRALLGDRYYKWDNCSGFEVVHPGLIRGGDLWAYVRVIPSDTNNTGVIPRSWRVRSLGRLWELDADKLGDLLENARERWGQA